VLEFGGGTIAWSNFKRVGRNADTLNGKQSSDFATDTQGGAADTAVQSAKVGGFIVPKGGTELAFPAYPDISGLAEKGLVVPNTRMVNGKRLDQDISLTPEDVGAVPYIVYAEATLMFEYDIEGTILVQMTNFGICFADFSSVIVRRSRDGAYLTHFPDWLGSNVVNFGKDIVIRWSNGLVTSWHCTTGTIEIIEGYSSVVGCTILGMYIQ
jgi:hypothetical protein